MVFTIGCEVRGGSGCLIPSVLLYCSCFRDDESALLRIEQTSMGKLHDFTWLLHPGCGASLIKIRITSRCVCTFLCRQNIKISKKNVLDKSWTLTFQAVVQLSVSIVSHRPPRVSYVTSINTPAERQEVTGRQTISGSSSVRAGYFWLSCSFCVSDEIFRQQIQIAAFNM